MFQTRVPGVASGSHRVSHVTDTPALRRFGDVTFRGQQVTIRNLETPSRASAGDLISVLNWFNLTPPRRTSPLTTC